MGERGREPGITGVGVGEGEVSRSHIFIAKLTSTATYEDGTISLHSLIL